MPTSYVMVFLKVTPTDTLTQFNFINVIMVQFSSSQIKQESHSIMHVEQIYPYQVIKKMVMIGWRRSTPTEVAIHRPN